MSWIIEALISAALLGLYDICKKLSVTGNAVFPTLFLSVLCGAALWAPWTAISLAGGLSRLPEWLQVDPLGWRDHLRLLAKAVLVGSSWILSYFALKRLPLSLAGGIRATSPFWTLLGGVVLFAERPSGLQWAGMTLTLSSFFALSWAGSREGVSFHRDRWSLCMIAASVLGSASGLYDKRLLGTLGYSAPTVQAWFSLYLALVIAPFALGWLCRWWPRGVFHWRWSIPLIGVFLLAADYAYFSALEKEDAMISVVSCLRRGSVLVTFKAGYLIFRERNYLRKTPGTLGILGGIALIALG